MIGKWSRDLTTVRKVRTSIQKSRLGYVLLHAQDGSETEGTEKSQKDWW